MIILSVCLFTVTQNIDNKCEQTPHVYFSGAVRLYINISYNEFVCRGGKKDHKCDKSFLGTKPTLWRECFNKTHHNLFWKCVKQTFNMIWSGVCFPCLSRAQFVLNASRRRWAEKWPFSSLMLLHYGMTSGWASERIFTSLLLISL